MLSLDFSEGVTVLIGLMCCDIGTGQWHGDDSLPSCCGCCLLIVTNFCFLFPHCVLGGIWD